MLSSTFLACPLCDMPIKWPHLLRPYLPRFWFVIVRNNKSTVRQVLYSTAFSLKYLTEKLTICLSPFQCTGQINVILFLSTRTG